MAFHPSFRLRSLTLLWPTLVFLTGSAFFLFPPLLTAIDEAIEEALTDEALADEVMAEEVMADEAMAADRTEEKAATKLSEQNRPVLNWEMMNQADPVPECDKAVSENGLYKEAFEILRPWAVNPETSAGSLSRAVEIGCAALENLNRTAEIDSFLEEILAAHSKDWRVLAAVARQYGSLTPYGVIKGGIFIRADQRGRQVLASERDRVRSLQIMTEAMRLLEEERALGKTSPKEVFDFYRSFAQGIGGDGMESWRFQRLTDWTRLPDYDENGHPRFGRGHSFAPVDDNGQPVFYAIPTSFETARNDGERWRFLLKKASESGSEDAADAELVYADFLQGQFGPVTLWNDPRFFRSVSEDATEENPNGDNENGDNPNGDNKNETPDRTDGEKSTSVGIGTLASLSDDETIARLADGVKRFSFPEDQNYLRIYQKIMDAASDEGTPDGTSSLERNRRRAAESLGREYLNRRQFVKAEEIFRRLAEMESSLPEAERTAKMELDRIVGNYGAFDPTQTSIAGVDASFSWWFRNGKSVRFLVHEINIPRLLDDVRSYLLECEKNPPKEWDPEKIDLENIGWRLLNDPSAGQKYLLDEGGADWSVDLTPAPDHRDKRITIPFPIRKAGAYLLRGKMENGNSDAVVLWLNDTALLKKQLDGRTLWFVADAKTGAPVEGADLDFFGYSMRRQPSGKPRKGASRNGGSELDFKIEKWTVKTDSNGLYLQKPNDSASNPPNGHPVFHWLVKATTPAAEDGNGRFAYYGFGGIWFARNERDAFENTRAFFISDRPIYRPNDSIHYKFWVGTAKYDLPETWTWGGKRVRVTILGPGGTKLAEKEVDLDETGGFEDVLETGADSKLGYYSFRLAAPIESPWGDASNQNSRPRWRNLGEGSVRLEEYKKPEFEVTVDAPTEPVKLGDSFKAKIRANYYFGSPVAHARVRYSVTRTTMNERWFPVRSWDWLYGNGYGWLASDASWFPGWSKWGVPRPALPWFPSYAGPPEEVVNNETEIGEDGTVEITIDSSPAATIYPNDDQRYEITAEVTDASRRTIVGSGKVLVAAEPFKVYAWAEKGFYGPNQQIDVSFQSRRLDGKPVPGEAQITVYQIRYEEDSEKTGEVKPVETELFSDETTVDAEGKGKSSFTLTEAGQYRFSSVLTDKNGNRREGGTLLSVCGRALNRTGGSPLKIDANSDNESVGQMGTASQTFRSNPLEIVPEKSEYRSGETVRLKVNTLAPDSTVLLFLRSEDGIAKAPEVLRTAGPETIYEFRLTDADSPNIFVEAISIREGHFYYEMKEIAVPPVKRVLNVDVTPEKNDYQPGEHAALKVKVTDSDGKPVVGEMAAAIYDRSLDALADGSSGTDLKEFFWNWKRHLHPQNDHSLEKVFYPIDFPNKKEMTPLGLFGEFTERFSRSKTVSFGLAEVSFSLGGGEGGRGIVTFSKSVPRSVNGLVRGMTAGGMMDSGAFQENNAMAADSVVDFDDAKTESAMDPSDSSSIDAKVRKDFADTALWIGRLQTDSSGVAEISLDMPENLTTWKTRVWTFAPGTRVGEGTAEMVTRKNLILRMQRPRFLTQTDRVLLSANVHNYFDREKRVTVSLEIDPEAEETEKGSAVLPVGGQSAASSKRIVTIPAGGEARVDWEVEAKRGGAVSLVMKAQTDEESDGMKESIPVFVHGILKQETVSGMIPAQTGETSHSERKKDREAAFETAFEVTVPEERIPEQTSLTVRFSPTLAGAMIDALPYLTAYPYGCSEQTLNRFLPTVLTQKLLADLGVDLTSLAEKRANLNAQELGDPDARRQQWNQKRNIFGEMVSETDSETALENPVFDPAEVARRVSAGIERLAELQCDDGGWGWFGGWGERSDPHLTALITEGLTLARQAGAEIPDDLILRGRSWLEAQLVRETQKLENGEKWSDDAKKEAPSDWKESVSAEDVLIFRVLNERGISSSDDRNPLSDGDRDSVRSADVRDIPETAANESVAAGVSDLSETLDRMKGFIWRDRTKITPYALALYGLALTEQSDAADAERIEMTVRILRQYLKTDETNQTAWLDLGGTSGPGGVWRWWSWSGDAIETQAALLRLLVRTEPNGSTAPRLVKYLLNNRKNATYWRSTRDTALCLAAFAEFIRATGEMSREQTVEILVDGTVKKRVEITPENLFAIDNTLRMEGSELAVGNHSVTIRKTGEGPLYYNAALTNFTLENFIQKTGLEVGVTRKYWKLTEDDSATRPVAGGHGEAIDQRVRKFKRELLESGQTVQSGDLIEVELLVTSKNDYESLLIEDRKPAGFEAVDPVSGYDGNRLGAYVEYRDARVCFFVHRLERGDHSLTYRLRAETPGSVSALPATIGGMYAPELKGNSDEFKTSVAD